MTDNNTVSRQGFIVGWIISTFLGWFTGFIIGCFAYLAFFSLSPLPYNSSFIAFSILLISVWLSASFVSLIQWGLNLYDKVNFRSWIIANTISATLSIFTLRLIAVWEAIIETTSEHSGFYQTYEVSKQWFILVLGFSIMLGLALSLPRWFILRSQNYQPQQLIQANILAIFISLSGMFLLILAADNDFRIMTLWCCINPVIIGGIIGSTLYRILYKSLS